MGQINLDLSFPANYSMKILLSNRFLLLISLSLWISLSFGAVPVVKTVVVDLKGHGHFRSIQQAINSIPNDNPIWTKIHIKAGVYWEKVKLPIGKGRLVFEGEGAGYTTIQWNDHSYAPTSAQQNKAMQTPDTATFTSAATDVVFKGITFKNTFGHAQNIKIGVAMLVSGDKTSFYSCAFVGLQDTLCDLQGRHYFKDCEIMGVVDFIFGFARSIYETCNIVTLPGLKMPGWVTAQGRFEAVQPSGFVFKNCRLKGASKVYLGRAWGRYSRVIFYNTFMDDIVVPQGWDSWRAPNKGLDTEYGEISCTGAGANTKGRVPWEKKMKPEYIREVTSLSFIDSEGWLANQGW